MKIARLFVLSVVIICASGCATIFTGKEQIVTVATNPPGAVCELTRESQVVGTVNLTPGPVTISKAKQHVVVLCKKDGYREATASINPGLVGATFLSVLFGPVGLGIDLATGAYNKYPETTTVSLTPLESTAASKRSPGKIAPL